MITYLVQCGLKLLSIFRRLFRWSLRMDKKFHPTLYNGCNYLSMLGLKLTHASKIGLMAYGQGWALKLLSVHLYPTRGRSFWRNFFIIKGCWCYSLKCCSVWEERQHRQYKYDNSKYLSSTKGLSVSVISKRLVLDILWLALRMLWS